MVVRGAAVLGAGLLAGCLGVNPAFGGPAAAGTGSTSGSGSSTSSGAGPGSVPGSGSGGGTGSATTDGSATDTAATSTAATETSVVMVDGDLLFVVGDPTFAALNDAQVADELTDMGFTVQVVESTTTAEAEAVELVVVSATADNGAVRGRLRDAEVPVVTWNHEVYPELGLTDDVLDEDYGVDENVESIRVVGTVGGGAKGEHSLGVQSPPGPIAWGNPSNAAWVAAIASGATEDAVLFGYDAGDEGADEDPIPARRVGFPFGASESQLTGAGLALLRDSVLWAVGS